MANRPYDQDWLDYQYEVGLRHHRTKKNRTDDVLSADNVSFRYILAQTYPMSAMIRVFLARSGDSTEDLDKMHQAWTKSLLLHVILWSYPYVQPGDF